MTTGAIPEILCVVGARPNFMKIAPLMVALKSAPRPLRACLLHTGQHYDVAMNERFFEQLGLAAPDINLEVGSASHAVQTADIMRRFEPVLDECRPAAVLVVGDVNSTLACALVAAKKSVPVIHVEAGLRSFDRTMPEEINRVLTDQLSELLFTTERHALDNLVREGIAPARVHFVGNVMIDTLLASLRLAVPVERTLADSADPARFLRRGYGVVTLHRPANVDDPAVLTRIVRLLSELSADLPLVFPLHPRTAAMLRQAGLLQLLQTPCIACLPPLGYLDMLGLLVKARLALTDSGGIQEETTALGVPCITLRENTERPITVEQGTNTLTGSDPVLIRRAVVDTLSTGGKSGRMPELWDGHAAARIAAVIAAWAHGELQQMAA